MHDIHLQTSSWTVLRWWTSLTQFDTITWKPTHKYWSQTSAMSTWRKVGVQWSWGIWYQSNANFQWILSNFDWFSFPNRQAEFVHGVTEETGCSVQAIYLKIAYLAKFVSYPIWQRWQIYIQSAKNLYGQEDFNYVLAANLYKSHFGLVV